MFNLGFSYIGLIYLLMLFLPNIVWTKYKPDHYEEYAKKENKTACRHQYIYKLNK